MTLAIFFLGAAFGIALMNIVETLITVQLKKSVSYAMIGDISFNMLVIFICIRLVLEGL